MKHLTVEETKDYRRLDNNDIRFSMKQVVGYTLISIPDSTNNLEEVVYYGLKDNIEINDEKN